MCKTLDWVITSVRLAFWREHIFLIFRYLPFCFTLRELGWGETEKLLIFLNHSKALKDFSRNRMEAATLFSRATALSRQRESLAHVEKIPVEESNIFEKLCVHSSDEKWRSLDVGSDAMKFWLSLTIRNSSKLIANVLRQAFAQRFEISPVRRRGRQKTRPQTIRGVCSYWLYFAAVLKLQLKGKSGKFIWVTQLTK